MDHADYKRIEEAILFLTEHALQQPTLEEVARQLGLSPYHCQRLFKSWAGVSPKRFLQYLTVEHAKSLLSESASVLDAALDVGLSGPGRLHDLFVSVEAMTPGEFKGLGEALRIDYAFHATPFGDCLLAATGKGICSLGFVEPGNRGQALAELFEEWQGASFAENPAAGQDAIRQFFAPADLRQPGAVKLLLRGTNFQIKVWQALLRIPEGALVSYGDLATSIGCPAASRAVGTAVGRNPVAYLIPCHRVFRANGLIGGYRWGVSRKRAMLALESASREPLPVAAVEPC